MTGPGSGTGGAGTRNARTGRTGLDPVVGMFFAEFLAAGALGVVFPDCADEFEGNSAAGAAA